MTSQEQDAVAGENRIGRERKMRFALLNASLQPKKIGVSESGENDEGSPMPGLFGG
jgi:hypothetical protein